MVARVSEEEKKEVMIRMQGKCGSCYKTLGWGEEDNICFACQKEIAEKHIKRTTLDANSAQSFSAETNEEPSVDPGNLAR